ncbi:hypothetical protein C8R47DRAFT_1190235 [Mycena vitilis]|nr:hypothetical protein C8R47DRAFT_1190235 [Mycena vitilis]
MRATEAPRSGAELAETMYRGPASGASKQIFLPPAGKVPAYAFNAAQPTCIFRLPQAPRSGADVVASMEGGRSVLGQGCSHCVLFHDVSPSGKRELHGYSIAATAASTPALTAKPQTQNSIFELPASGISSTGLDSGAMCTIPAQNAGCGAKILGLFEPRRRAEKSIIHATLESIRVFFRAAGAGLNQVSWADPENLPCGAFTLSVNFEGQILKNFLMRSVKLELRGKGQEAAFLVGQIKKISLAGRDLVASRPWGFLNVEVLIAKNYKKGERGRGTRLVAGATYRGRGDQNKYPAADPGASGLTRIEYLSGSGVVEFNFKINRRHWGQKNRSSAKTAVLEVELPVPPGLNEIFKIVGEDSAWRITYCTCVLRAAVRLKSQVVGARFT